jgi:hypothetical protein
MSFVDAWRERERRSGRLIDRLGGPPSPGVGAANEAVRLRNTPHDSTHSAVMSILSMGYSNRMGRKSRPLLRKGLARPGYSGRSPRHVLCYSAVKGTNVIIRAPGLNNAKSQRRVSHPLFDI